MRAGLGFSVISWRERRELVLTAEVGDWSMGFHMLLWHIFKILHNKRIYIESPLQNSGQALWIEKHLV